MRVLAACLIAGAAAAAPASLSSPSSPFAIPSEPRHDPVALANYEQLAAQMRMRRASVSALPTNSACSSPAAAMPVNFTSGNALPSAIAAAISKFDSALPQILSASGSASIALALVYQDQLVHFGSAGSITNTSTVPPTLDSVYMLGSVSKVFTALAALQQVQAGTVSWDTPIEELLPGCSPLNPWDSAESGAGASPTVRQLLSHMGGVPRNTPCPGYSSISCTTTLEDFCSVLSNWTLTSAPGTVSDYSNSGFTMVGRGMEAAGLLGGLSFEDFTQQALLEQLGMLNSTWSPPADLSTLASASFASGAAVPPYTLSFDNPAGGLFSTARDMASFMGYLLSQAGSTVPTAAAASSVLGEGRKVAGAGAGAKRGKAHARLRAQLQEAAASKQGQQSLQERKRKQKASSGPLGSLPPLPSASQIRSWLRSQEYEIPSSLPGGGTVLQSGYGLPWERYRVDLSGTNGTAGTDGLPTYTLVTKAGDVPGYDSFLALLPDLQLGMIGLRATSPAAYTAQIGIAAAVFQSMWGMFVPAFQQSLLALENAALVPSAPASDFTGTYVASFAPAATIYDIVISANSDGSLQVSNELFYGSTQLLPAGENAAFGEVFQPAAPPALSCSAQTEGAFSIMFVRNQTLPGRPVIALNVAGDGAFPSIFLKT